MLNRVLTPAYFEEMIDEAQTQISDTEALDQKLEEKQQELREVERGISNLLDLAEAFGAGAALERLKKREAEKASLLASLRQLEARREMAQVQVTPVEKLWGLR